MGRTLARSGSSLLSRAVTGKVPLHLKELAKQVALAGGAHDPDRGRFEFSPQLLHTTAQSGSGRRRFDQGRTAIGRIPAPPDKAGPAPAAARVVEAESVSNATARSA